MRIQSAIEYLMTYGWAILIISVALSALYISGLFNPSTEAGTACVLPAGFSCPSIILTPNGILTINILQSNIFSLNVTAIGCNTNITTAHMTIPNNPPSNQINIPSGGSYTFPSIQCYAGSAAYSGTVGSEFAGYISLNYTSLQAGLPQTVVGKLFAKIS